MSQRVVGGSPELHRALQQWAKRGGLVRIDRYGQCGRGREERLRIGDTGERERRRTWQRGALRAPIAGQVHGDRLARDARIGHAARILSRSVCLGVRGGSLSIALAVLSMARVGAAFPSSRLVYVRGPGAEQCPSRDAVRQAVAARLGYDPFFSSSDKTIIARVLRQAHHLVGQVELVDEGGVQVGLREFSAEPDHCGDLIRAMALSISIAIDPKSAETYGQGPADDPPGATTEATGDTETQPVAKPTEAPPLPPYSAPARDVPRASQAPAADARVRTSAGIAARAPWGSAPQLTLGGTLFGAMRFNAWSIALEGSVDLPVVTGQRGVSLRMTTYGFNAVPCVHYGVGFVCAVGSLRWLGATRTEPGAKGDSQGFWAFGARIGAELPLTEQLGLLGYVDVLAAPEPPRVSAVSELLWQSPVLRGDLAIAGALHF